MPVKLVSEDCGSSINDSFFLSFLYWRYMYLSAEGLLGHCPRLVVTNVVKIVCHCHNLSFVTDQVVFSETVCTAIEGSVLVTFA